MITQKQIDDYNYMLKASEGIILVKQEEDIYSKKEDNNYRELKDILYNIDDICDKCNLIGLGLNPHTKKLYNHSAINYPFLKELLQEIRKKYKEEFIFITAEIKDLTEEKILILNQFNNIILNINLYNSIIVNNKINLKLMKNEIEYLKKYKNILPHIDCFYIPYSAEYKIDNLLLSLWDIFNANSYYYYCYNDNKDNYLNFINKLNFNNKKRINILEELGNEIDIRIINIINNIKTDFKINDILIGINNQYFNFKDDFYNFLFDTPNKIYDFHILRKGEIKKITCEKSVFLNNIILNNDIKNICKNIYPEIFYNEKNSLILYPDYNIDILIKKIKKSYSVNSNIEPILTNHYFDNKKITLEDCRKALNNFRKNNKNKLITTLYIPHEIIQNILMNNKDISLEQFQIETLTVIEQI